MRKNRILPVVAFSILGLGLGLLPDASAATIDFLSCQRLLSDPELGPLAQEITNKAAELKARGQLTSPVTWRAEMAGTGLAALDLPTALGGRNLPVSQMASLFEYAGQFGLDLRDVIGAGHARLLTQSQSTPVLDVVREVAAGQAYVAIALTEADAGSDMHAIRSFAERAEGGYLLTGSKLYNARLQNATHVILYTQSPDRSGRLNPFLVPLNNPGLKIVDLEAHGLLGNSFGGLNFERLFVPTSMAIGEDAQGGEIFRRHFLYWRLMMAAAAVGTGRGALEQVPDRLLTREVYGGPIGRFTHLQQPLAEHTAKIHMAHLLVQNAARQIDAGDLEQATILVAMAKAEGVEIALAAANFAMTSFGAEGYSTKVDLGQRVIDLMGLRIADGTTDVLRSEITKRVFGSQFWDLAVGPRPSHPGAMPPIASSMLGGAPPSSFAMPAAGNEPFPEPDMSGDGEMYAGLAGMPALGSPPADGYHGPDLSRVMTTLQKNAEPVLAVQGDFDALIRPGGGGACPTVNAFNLLQILHAAQDPTCDSHLNSAAVIADAFSALPELLDGRVQNHQFIRLMNYFSRHLDPGKIDFDIEIVPAPKKVRELKAPVAGELHGYIYDVYQKNGERIGRHFVTLKKKNGNRIVTLEPQKPLRDYEYQLVPGEGIYRGRIRLQSPGTSQYSRYLESIVRIELH